MKRSDVSDRQALEAVRPIDGVLPPLDGLNYMENDSALQRLQHAGVPFKVALRKLEHLDDRGLIEYGVSLNFPWRTEKGEAALARLIEADAEAIRAQRRSSSAAHTPKRLVMSPGLYLALLRKGLRM